MTPQQQVDLNQPLPSIITQKVQLTYKLFLLENARNTLERELLNFTSKAYEDVQCFFSSTFSSSVFNDLAKALDSKCQAVNKLSALLKDLTVKPHICVENEVRTDQLQPLGNKAILMKNFLKFGPMLQNSLMASSIAKAAQVLGATLSVQQLKHVLISQPAAVQQDDIKCSISSSYNSSSSHLKAENKEHAVVFEEKSVSDAVSLPPSIMQSTKYSADKPPILLPCTQAIFPEVSNSKTMEIMPLISWGCGDDVQVQHQKQTSSQLLHFLRAKAKNVGALEVTVMEWSKNTHISYISGSPQSMSPTVNRLSCQFGHVTEDFRAQAPQKLSADVENQTPVFRVKRVDSSGSLTYTCVIATKTELWDIGDIFTNAGQGDSEAISLGNKDYQKMKDQSEDSSGNSQWKAQDLQCTGPEHEGSSAGAGRPLINGFTIPEFQIRRFEETEVVVSHIISPGNFYIQQADCITKLQALVKDSWKASSSYAEQNCIPDIGTKVMGWFPKQEQWCRAQVTKICGVSGDDNVTDGVGKKTSFKVEVKRLDHGDTACLSLWNIKEMTQEMAVLPLQSVQVSLANVTPVNGSEWSEEAVGWFQAMVHNRTLYARLYPQGPKVTVELFLEKGKLGAMRRGAALSLRLAQNGHANHCKLRNVSFMKKGSVQVEMRKRDSEWEKYLISCYTQSKK